MLETEYEKQLRRLIEAQEKRIDELFNNFIQRFAGTTGMVNESVFRSNTAWKRILTRESQLFGKQMEDTLKKGISQGWSLADKKNDVMVGNFLKGKNNVPGYIREAAVKRNSGALEAFIARKRNGLNLSDRVWKIKEQARQTIEATVQVGIEKGLPATQIAFQIKPNLLEPNNLFRRVRDPQTGQLRLSAPAERYHPGRGVYRSSHKNAMRVARTETNMAFRTADTERRKDLPFVTGIEVKLSASHPVWDICDEMKGDYPKGFIFAGWHPHCLCYSVTKMMDDAQFTDYLKNGGWARGQTRTMPDSAVNYLGRNLHKLQDPGKRPYFVRDNFINIDRNGMELRGVIGEQQIRAVQPPLPFVEVPAGVVPTSATPSIPLGNDGQMLFDFDIPKPPRIPVTRTPTPTPAQARTIAPLPTPTPTAIPRTGLSEARARAIGKLPPSRPATPAPTPAQTPRFAPNGGKPIPDWYKKPEVNLKPKPNYQEFRGMDEYMAHQRENEVFTINIMDRYEYQEFKKNFNNFDVSAMHKDIKKALKDAGLKPTRVTAEFEKDRITYKCDYKEIAGTGQGNLERNFYKLYDEANAAGEGLVEVDHTYFKLPESVQGNGVSKTVFQALYKHYKQVGVDKLRVHANLDIGGWTWGRYGFSSTDSNRLYRILDWYGDKNRLAAEKMDKALNLYAKNKKPGEPFRFPMRRWTDIPGAKDILLDSDWYGNLYLNNPNEERIFLDYLFNRAPK